MSDEVVAPVRRSAWWRRVSGRMDCGRALGPINGFPIEVDDRPVTLYGDAGAGQSTRDILCPR